MYRRVFCFTVLSAVLYALMVAGGRTTASSAKLNVIVVISDSLRARNLELYGYSRPTSPNLVRLASDAIIYERAYSHYSFTWPSISNLFTGRAYSALVGEGRFTTPSPRKDFEWVGGLEPENETLAELLRESGVASYGVSASPYVSRRTGLVQGFERFFDWDDWGSRIAPGEEPYLSAEAVNDVAMTYLRELRSDSRPWFMYLHYMDTHMRYHASPRDLALFGDASYTREDRVCDGAALEPSGKWLKWRTEEFEGWLEERDVVQLEAYYDAQILRFDRAIAALMRHLDVTGVRESTIVVITSDHGESLFERGFWGHGYLSRDEEQHIPLVVILPPGMANGPRHLPFPVTTADVFHAVLENYGAERPTAKTVAKVADLFSGTPHRPVAYSEGPGATTVYRDGRYALYRHRDLEARGHRISFASGEYLYDLQADPGETRDLLAVPTEAASRTRDRLLASSSSEPPPPTTEDPMLESGGRLRESLRALGYVE